MGRVSPKSSYQQLRLGEFGEGHVSISPGDKSLLSLAVVPCAVLLCQVGLFPFLGEDGGGRGALLLQTTATLSLMVQGYERQWSVTAKVSFQIWVCPQPAELFQGAVTVSSQGALGEKEAP